MSPLLQGKTIWSLTWLVPAELPVSPEPVILNPVLLWLKQVSNAANVKAAAAA